MASRAQQVKRLARRRAHQVAQRTAKIAGAAPAPTPKAAGRAAAAAAPRVAAGAPGAVGGAAAAPAATVAASVAGGAPAASGRRGMRRFGRGGGGQRQPGWIRQNPGKAMGGAALGISAIGLYRNTGPGVTGNGYMPTGSSSGGRQF